MTDTPPRPRAILFDWDNTLVDNWGAIHAALNSALSAMGQGTWTVAETRQRVRKSLRDSFPEMFGERWHEARDIFYRSFAASHLETLKPIDGAGELLAALAGEGLYLGVVSNKMGDYLRREADHLGWTGYFSRLIGAMDADQDKPAVAPVELALDGSGIQRSQEVWFVGDADIDIECAKNAGLTAVILHRENESRIKLAGAAESGLKENLSLGGCMELAQLVQDLYRPTSNIEESLK